MAMKGEIFNFIIRTATEFATRQTTAVDPERISSVTLTGFSKSAFNVLWSRTDFDVDNEPCFIDRRKKFFLHYRAGEGVGIHNSPSDTQYTYYDTFCFC